MRCWLRETTSAIAGPRGCPGRTCWPAVPQPLQRVLSQWSMCRTGSPGPPHSAQVSPLSAVAAAITPAIASRSNAVGGIVRVSHVVVSAVSSTGRPSSSPATTSAVRMSACQPAHWRLSPSASSSCCSCARSSSWSSWSSRLGHPPALVHDHRGERLGHPGRRGCAAASIGSKSSAGRRRWRRR